MCSLWVIYVFISIMQAYEKWGLETFKFGIKKPPAVEDGCCHKDNRKIGNCPATFKKFSGK